MSKPSVRDILNTKGSTEDKLLALLKGVQNASSFDDLPAIENHDDLLGMFDLTTDALTGDLTAEEKKRVEVMTLSQMANKEREKGDIEAAMKFSQHCEEKAGKGEQTEWMTAIMSRYNTAICWLKMKRFADAIALMHELQQELMNWKELTIGRSVIIDSLLNKTHLNGKVGKIIQMNVSPGRHCVNVEGNRVSVKATNLQVEVRPGEDDLQQLYLASVRGNLADAYYKSGNMKEAEDYYEQALNYYAKAKKCESKVTFLGQYLEFIMNNYKNVGDLDKLFRYQFNAISQVGCIAAARSQCFHAYGGYNLRIKHDFQKAVESFLKSLELDIDPRKKTITYSCLTNAYQMMGDFTSSHKYAKMGVDLARKCGSECLHELEREYKLLTEVLQKPSKRKQYMGAIQLMKEHDKRDQERKPKLNKNHRILIKSMILERKCGYCDGVSGTLRTCAACKEIYYCSKEHQKEHWKEHKLVCKVIYLVCKVI